MSPQASGISSKTLLFTAFALTAFAANSILCRLALGHQAIDASSFTIIRLSSGALVLSLILKIQHHNKGRVSRGSWSGAAMLFLYAITFSFAYLTLETGTGALILFAAVQLTMIITAIVRGERLRLFEWAGVLIACVGFVFLILPGVSAPSVSGFILMSIAGTAWGVYSLIGKKSVNPLGDTAFNFIRSLPFVLFFVPLAFYQPGWTTRGIVLAMMSGALASGVGYTIWYMALRGLSATQAAIVQLLVPLIAASGGIIFLAEIITLRLLISAVMIFGGVTIVLIKNNSQQKIEIDLSEMRTE